MGTPTKEDKSLQHILAWVLLQPKGVTVNIHVALGPRGKTTLG